MTTATLKSLTYTRRNGSTRGWDLLELRWGDATKSFYRDASGLLASALAWDGVRPGSLRAAGYRVVETRHGLRVYRLTGLLSWVPCRRGSVNDLPR